MSRCVSLLSFLSVLFISSLTFCVGQGSEAEAQVCANEEAAILHRGGRSGAQRLPAGQFKLDGSLMEQVSTFVSLWGPETPASH